MNVSGHNRDQPAGTPGAIKLLGAGILLLVAAAAVGAFLNPADKGQTIGATNTAAPTATSPPPVPAPAPDQIELLASRGTTEAGYLIVEGQVRNLTGQSQSGIEAVTTWYTKAGDFVKTSSAIIEFDPLLPGQTSPFKTITTGNPDATRYAVEFKPFMGSTLRTKDSRTTK